MKHYPVKLKAYLDAKDEYQNVILPKLSDRELIEEFLSYLDYTEESDSGRKFRPVVISCTRVTLTESLGDLIREMKIRSNRKEK